MTKPASFHDRIKQLTEERDRQAAKVADLKSRAAALTLAEKRIAPLEPNGWDGETTLGTA